ncbi:MAG: cell division protein FtsL [Gammaproteobacteria bacterium]
MTGAFFTRPGPLLLAAVCFFCWALHGAITQRHRARLLTGQLDSLQAESRILQDERRSLFLEYITITDYEKLRAAAADLGMREPGMADGTLLFFPADETP